MKLLTSAKEQAKMSKSAKSGIYLPYIMHLAPAKLSGYQVCSKATQGCTSACLNTSGHGRYQPVQSARIARTKLFFEDRETFIRMLVTEIEKGLRKADKEGKQMTLRLNGTSDIMWERLRLFSKRTVFEMFPDVIFYDYTKIPIRDPKPFKNYSLTFSMADGNELDTYAAIERGMNVAVVFRGTVLPDQFLSRPVIDGDVDDLRFLDPEGVVIGLLAKGLAKKDQSGFVKDVYIPKAA